MSTIISAQAPHERQRERGQGIWLRWTIAVALGELVGFAIPALAGAIAMALILPDTAVTVAVVVAGVGEGAVLGLFQWLALRHSLPVSGRAWIGATALAAGVAWVLGMALSALAQQDTLGIFPLIALATLLGVVFLLSMGGAQWVVLRHYVAHAGWWVVANAVAWPLGVAVPVVGMALVPDGASATIIAIVGVLCGLLMGVVVGAITGGVLARLLSTNEPAKTNA
jgi:hypothetical protein